MGASLRNILFGAQRRLAVWKAAGAEQGKERPSLDPQLRHRLFCSGRCLKVSIATQRDFNQRRWRQSPPSMLRAATGILGGASLLASRSYSHSMVAEEESLIAKLAAMETEERSTYLECMGKSAESSERKLAKLLRSALKERSLSGFINHYVELREVLGPIDPVKGRALFGDVFSAYDALVLFTRISDPESMNASSGYATHSRDHYFEILGNSTSKTRKWLFGLFDNPYQEKMRQFGRDLQEAYEAKTYADRIRAFHKLESVLGSLNFGSFYDVFGDFYQPATETNWFERDRYTDSSVEIVNLNNGMGHEWINQDRMLLLNYSKRPGPHYEKDRWGYGSWELLSYERKSGRMQWAVPLAGSFVDRENSIGLPDKTWETPDGIALISLAARRLTFLDPGTGELRSAVKLPRLVQASNYYSVSVDGSGRLYIEVLDIPSGQFTLYVGGVDRDRMEWKEEYQVGYFHGRLRLFDDRPFLWDLSNGLALLRQDGTVSDFQLGGRIEIAYHNGKVYAVAERDIRNQWALEVFDLDVSDSSTFTLELEKTITFPRQFSILKVQDAATLILRQKTDHRQVVEILNPNAALSGRWEYPLPDAASVFVDATGAVWCWGKSSEVYRISKGRHRELVGHVSPRLQLAHVEGENAYFVDPYPNFSSVY